MEKTEARRQLILNQIADHLLAAGLMDASQRHLSAAIGTSYWHQRPDVAALFR